MKTYEGTVYSATGVSVVCLWLIKWSQWFQITPMPDDEYVVTVKYENRHALDGIIRHAEE